MAKWSKKDKARASTELWEQNPAGIPDLVRDALEGTQEADEYPLLAA